MVRNHLWLRTIALPILVFAGLLLARQEPKADRGLNSPPSAPALQELNEFSRLADDYNRSEGRVRLVTLLSPTCPYCVAGLRAVKQILNRNKAADLKVFIVWEPMLHSDDFGEAREIAGELEDDDRVVQYWDAERITGKHWRETLDINQIAWDVYMLYDREDRWASAPTMPDFWMHQLSGVDKAPHLDDEELENRLLALLNQ